MLVSPLAGIEGLIRHPFFSPDGNWIGFENFGENALYKVPFVGGSAQKICNLASGSWGINWYDNEILFGQNDGIYRVVATGGTPEKLYPLNENDDNITIWNPQLLPDKNTILFNQYSQAGFWDVRLWKFNSQDSATILIDRGIDARYLSSGHIAYIDDQRLYINKFDLKSNMVKGTAQIITTESILNSAQLNQVAQFAFSESGMLAYHSSFDEKRRLVWIDQNGNAERISRDENYFYSPRISSDGRQIVVDALTNHWQIKLVDTQLGTASVFIDLNPQERTYTPLWSSDNTSITYIVVNEDNRTRIFEKPLDQSYAPIKLLELDNLTILGNWSQDGRYLLFYTQIERSGWDIGYFDRLDSTTAMLDFINTPGTENVPKISPDGKWLAFTSNKDGSSQVYVVPFPGPGQRYHISVDPGIFPVWAPDMKALYFIDAVENSKMWRANIQTEPRFHSEEPMLLFSGLYYSKYGGNVVRFDIHPDGDRFLGVQFLNTTTDYTIQMVINWQQDIINQ